MRKRHRGFTLIELMVAVGIIGLLVAIALPSYLRYTLRAQRATAKAFLTQVMAKEESYFNDRKTYAGVLGPTGLGYSADTIYLDSNGAVGATSSTGLFSVAVSACLPAGCATNPTTRVTVTATAINKQTSDGCSTLVLSTDGTKSATGSGASECWKN